MRVGFMGKMGAGKSTAAKYLVDEYSFTKASLATPVKEIGKVKDRPEDEWLQSLKDWSRILLPESAYDQELLIGGTLRDDLVWAWVQDLRRSKSRRELLQRIGTDSGRAISSTIWVNYLRRYLPDGDLVIDDVRFISEVEALRDLGFIMVRIDLGEESRRSRLEERDGSFDASTQGHASETELATFEPDAVLSNNGSLEMLKQSLVSLIGAFRGREYVA
jgi:dephospho-CoA kinase